MWGDFVTDNYQLMEKQTVVQERKCNPSIPVVMVFTEIIIMLILNIDLGKIMHL